MKPVPVWSPGFSRSKPFEPPEWRNSKPTQVHGDPLAIFAVHWDHEPVRIPLNRPPGTFSPTGGYLFSGSGCRAATTPPRAAAERLARTTRFAGSLCAAGRGATRRSATSSTTLNRYTGGEGWDEGVRFMERER